jgi:hypothetical protein
MPKTLDVKEDNIMSKFGDKLRKKLGLDKSKVERLEHKKKKMQARQQDKAGKIIGKADNKIDKKGDGTTRYDKSNKKIVDRANKKLAKHTKKTDRKSARYDKRIKKAKEKADYKAGKTQKQRTITNPLTGESRITTKWRRKDGTKEKSVQVVKTRGAMNTKEHLKKEKRKSGHTNKIKKKHISDKYGISTKTVKSRAKHEQGGIGGRKKKWSRKRFRDDPTLKRKTRIDKRGKERVVIGKGGGYVDK